MGKWLREKLNGDLADPLNLNILVYTFTYALSILSCVLSFAQLDKKEASLFLQQFNDTLVPTTATLVLGSVIQNFAEAVEGKISRCALSLWAMLAAILYMVAYHALRVSGLVWFSYAVLVCSVGIVVLSMFSINQIETEKRKRSPRSPSG